MNAKTLAMILVVSHVSLSAIAAPSMNGKGPRAKAAKSGIGEKFVLEAPSMKLTNGKVIILNDLARELMRIEEMSKNESWERDFLTAKEEIARAVQEDNGQQLTALLEKYDFIGCKGATACSKAFAGKTNEGGATVVGKLLSEGGVLQRSYQRDGKNLVVVEFATAPDAVFGTSLQVDISGIRSNLRGEFLVDLQDHFLNNSDRRLSNVRLDAYSKDPDSELRSAGGHTLFRLSTGYRHPMTQVEAMQIYMALDKALSQLLDSAVAKDSYSATSTNVRRRY